MTTRLDNVLDYLDDLLKCSEFDDYCPNGLQVEGKTEVKKIVSGVTASKALIDKAIEAQADALLVHHGYFWKHDEPTLTGMKRERIKALLERDISLIAYHLPLDTHLTLGNNAELAKVLDIKVSTQETVKGVPNLLWTGELAEQTGGADFAAELSQKLTREVLHIPFDNQIRRVAWCTGAAQDFIEDAARLGADAYISGEISERTTHIARELGIHYYSAGHHATERYGVKALGEHLAEHFNLDHLFIDIDNPA